MDLVGGAGDLGEQVVAVVDAPGVVGGFDADAGLFGEGDGVGQAAQQDALVDELQQAAVEADGEPAAGEVDADRGVAGRPGRSALWR
jgi:hypothetical protein